MLRLGFEDETAHAIQRVGKFVPKGGRLILKSGKPGAAHKGLPVFLIDRREKALADMLAELERALAPPRAAAVAAFQTRLPTAPRGKTDAIEIQIHRLPVRPPQKRSGRLLDFSRRPPGHLAGRGQTPVVVAAAGGLAGQRKTPRPTGGRAAGLGGRALRA